MQFENLRPLLINSPAGEDALRDEPEELGYRALERVERGVLACTVVHGKRVISARNKNKQQRQTSLPAFGHKMQLNVFSKEIKKDNKRNKNVK